MQKVQNSLIFVIALLVVLLFGASYWIVQKNTHSGTEVVLAPSLDSKTEKSSNTEKNTDSQKQCFQMLKDNMKETEMFDTPLQEMKKMTYEDLASKFSRNYKGLSSFGIDISEDDFEMRLYSFGDQTGYVHPPITPFPTSKKSELWDEPAKQFIIAEEYVTDGEGNKKFMDCAFISISSKDLQSVTRENYLFDGAMISLNKTAPDQSYKAWYSENISFDHSGKPFVKWNRLFVYPQSSQNEYFDKYTVAQAYPGNTVGSFDVLHFFFQSMIQVQEYDENNQAKTKFLVFKEGAEKPEEVEMPKELEPVTQEGVNKIFPMNGYYQAIENSFPAFSESLSFRGSLKYETFKQIISENEINPEAKEILEALGDYRQLVAYDINKKANTKDGVVVTDEKLDKLLVAVNDADTAIAEIPGVVTNDSGEENKETVEEGGVNHYVNIVASIIIFIIASFLVVVIRKKYLLNKEIL